MVSCYIFQRNDGLIQVFKRNLLATGMQGCGLFVEIALTIVRVVERRREFESGHPDNGWGHAFENGIKFLESARGLFKPDEFLEDL